MPSKSSEGEWDSRFRTMIPRVYRFFAYQVTDGAIAEDLTGETFERAWKSRRRYRKDRGAWESWILGIARHVVVDHFKRQERQGLSPHEPLVDGGRPTEEAAAKQTEVSRLLAMVSSLKERERDLVALKYGAELTNREIAELTGLSESNVGTILHRVVSRLRERWKDDER